MGNREKKTHSKAALNIGTEQQFRGALREGIKHYGIQFPRPV